MMIRGRPREINRDRGMLAYISTRSNYLSEASRTFIRGRQHAAGSTQRLTPTEVRAQTRASRAGGA